MADADFEYVSMAAKFLWLSTGKGRRHGDCVAIVMA